MTPLPTQSPSFVLVTPEMARDWLTRNLPHVNRNLRPTVVLFYADLMARGLWERTTDGIGFRHDGVLINGQHRLHAIVRSGVSVWLLVVTGMSDEAYTLIDRGVSRTAHDALHLPPHLLADVSLIFRIITKGMLSGRIADIDLRNTASWWAPAWRAMEQHSYRVGMGGASLRVAFSLRWAIETDPAKREHIAGQYAALALTDGQAMTKATSTLWNRMKHDKIGAQGSARERIEHVASAYYYANPKRAYVAPLIKEASRQALLDEMRGMLKATEDARLLADPGENHPYDYVKAFRSQRRIDGSYKSKRIIQAQEGLYA